MKYASKRKLSFTTLACPDWDVAEIVRNASEYGYDGVDFRGTRSGIDITLLDEFRAGLPTTLRMLSDAGLEVSGISSGIALCVERDFAKNIEEAKRTIDLALGMGVGQVRVFGFGDAKESRSALLDQGRRCMEAILELEGASHVSWLLETHDNWIASNACREFVDAVGNSRFRVLWDIGHTTRVGSESPRQTIEAIGDLVECIHIKDAIWDPEHPYAMSDGWRYRLPGQGQLPLEEALTHLSEFGYAGWHVFEHEKRWHADLEEPDVALPQFVKWMRASGNEA